MAMNDPAMKAANAVKYGLAGKGRVTYLQPHAAFHFLLDYIPNWKKAYGTRGLIQYQMFVPEDAASGAFDRILTLQRVHGVYSYLAVLKRHREDIFAGRYSPDGFSMALDFAVRKNPERLLALLKELEALREDVGGRLYAAKDAVGAGTLPAIRVPGYSNDLARRWERSERSEG